jgi:hypothetical protein
MAANEPNARILIYQELDKNLLKFYLNEQSKSIRLQIYKIYFFFFFCLMQLIEYINPEKENV